jgi:hypothetical protein
VLDRRRFGPRNVAADESRDRPHHDRNGDNDGGENEHALKHRRVKPDILVVVIVVFAHRIRPKIPIAEGWFTALFVSAYPVTVVVPTKTPLRLRGSIRRLFSVFPQP